MRSYLELLDTIMRNGTDRPSRPGIHTRSIFGHQWRHRMSDGFPLLTTKRVFLKAVLHELLWFLQGDTNIKYLNDHGVTIWNEWADERGELGPVYGRQWRKWPDAGGWFDQIYSLVKGLRENPYGRRHIVSAWNVGQLHLMALPPCHTMFQCYVRDGVDEQFLDLHLYARSIDAFLGLPFNIASYATLLLMLSKVSHYSPGDLIISFGDLHIYENHKEQVILQQSRIPRDLPWLDLPAYSELEHFAYEDFTLKGYNPHPAIKADVAV